MLTSNHKVLRFTVTALIILYLIYILDWTNLKSDTQIVEQVQSYSYPTPNVEIVQSDNFPVLDADYVNQNGQVMIERTLQANMTLVKIAVDKSLERELSFVKEAQCAAGCQFYFSSDYDQMAAEADGLITDKTEGLLVNNAMLHFTKTVYQTQSAKNLREYTWYGTDMLAGMQNIPLKHDRELYGRPTHFIVHKTNETEKSIRRIVDYSEKQSYIAVFLHPGICQNQTVAAFLEDLQKQIAIHVVDGQCGFNSTVACGVSDTPCILKHAKASLIMDPFDQDSFVVPLFWQSIAHSTPVMYSWPGNFTEYAPGILNLKLSTFEPTVVIEFINRFTMKFYKNAFAWKKHTVPEPIAKMLNNSLPRMPCVLCNHIRERKISTLAAVKLFANTENVEVMVNENANTSSLQGLDAVFVNHYSKATERMGNIKQLSRDIKGPVRAVSGFDKDTYDPRWIDLILQNRETIENNPFRLASDRDLYPGETSLAFKSFWVYFRILKENLNNALVIEDDIQLNPYAKKFSNNVLIEKLPSTYSIFHLGQCISGYLTSLPQDGMLYVGNMKISSNLGDPRHCTSAYLISKQGAILMFKSLPLAMPIDYQMSGFMPFADGMTHQGRIDHPNLSIYSLWPAIFEPSVDINEMSNTGIRAG